MERIKKWCYWTFKLLQAISIIVFLLLANYYYCENKSSITSFYENKSSIISFDNETCLLSSSYFWSMITAIATVVAAVCAVNALNQSNTMRKHSSFDLLFTQLLSNMQSYINKATLQTTIVKAPWVWVTGYNRHYNTFLNFVNIYTEYMYINMYRTGQSILDKKKITELWKVYTMNLVNRSDFSNCFKYFYYIVDTVCKSPLDDARKKQYIGIIQAQLNYDILFCYLINQIVYPYKNPNEEQYPQLLREYDFFKDLCIHGYYGAIIKSTIKRDILEPFLHEETLESLFK